MRKNKRRTKEEKKKQRKRKKKKKHVPLHRKEKIAATIIFLPTAIWNHCHSATITTNAIARSASPLLLLLFLLLLRSPFAIQVNSGEFSPLFSVRPKPKWLGWVQPSPIKKRFVGLSSIQHSFGPTSAQPLSRADLIPISSGPISAQPGWA